MRGCWFSVQLWLLVGLATALGWGEQVRAICHYPLPPDGYVVVMLAGPVALGAMLIAPKPLCSEAQGHN